MSALCNTKNVPFNRALIHQVHKQPALWDRNETARTVTKQRDQIWVRIAKQMNSSAAECRKRWRSLRDTYRMYMKAKAKGKKQGLNWEHLEELAFLQTEIKCKDGTIVVNLDNDNDEEEEDSSQQQQQQRETRKRSYTTTTSQTLTNCETTAGSSAPRPPKVPRRPVTSPEIVPEEAQSASTPIPGRLISLNREKPEKLTPQACFLLSFEEILIKAGLQKELHIRAAITNFFIEHVQEEERLNDLADIQANF